MSFQLISTRLNRVASGQLADYPLLGMFDGFRLPICLARSPFGTLAVRNVRGRRRNIRDILGSRFSAFPYRPGNNHRKCWVASGSKLAGVAANPEATIENVGCFGEPPWLSR